LRGSGGASRPRTHPNMGPKFTVWTSIQLNIINSQINTQPPSGAGCGWGLGLLAPVPVPVCVLVWALGVLNALFGDPSGIRPQILGALREANLDCGAGGFFVVVSGAHARMIPAAPGVCAATLQKYSINTQRPFGALWSFRPPMWFTSRPIPRSLASRCLRPSPRGSCSRRHPRTLGCPLRGSGRPSSPGLPHTRGRGCRSQG